MFKNFILIMFLSFFVISSVHSENLPASNGQLQFSVKDQPGANGPLVLNVSNLRNANGSILVSIYNTKEGFPKHPETAAMKFKVIVNQVINPSAIQSAQILIPNLPHGEYSMAIAHDENANDQIDTGFLGIPKEGVGFSNNPNITFGPPSYEKAKFIFDPQNSVIAIKMHYY